MRQRRSRPAGWTHGVPIRDRGPGESYRPENPPPSVHAAHQPGIATPVQDHLEFTVLDLDVDSPPALSEVARELTEVAERLMRASHRTPGHGLAAGALTVTLGLGPGLFDERFGLAPRRPAALAPLPPFQGDALKPACSGGDLCLQVCAEGPALAAAATRELVASVSGGARRRWSVRASMRRRPGEPVSARPRNLLGFKEATGNPRRGKELERHVWVSRRERTWMLGGTFLVMRKIRVALDAWSSLPLERQEAVIGRHRASGALLGRRHEFEPLTASDTQVPADAHVRLAGARENDGARLLRRGYSYSEESGEEAGMVLLFFQRDPRRQFVPIQTRLATGDALTGFTETVGSGVFAIPPGAGPGEYLAQPLLSPRP